MLQYCKSSPYIVAEWQWKSVGVVSFNLNNCNKIMEKSEWTVGTVAKLCSHSECGSVWTETGLKVERIGIDNSFQRKKSKELCNFRAFHWTHSQYLRSSGSFQLVLSSVSLEVLQTFSEPGNLDLLLHKNWKLKAIFLLRTSVQHSKVWILNLPILESVQLELLIWWRWKAVW